MGLFRGTADLPGSIRACKLAGLRELAPDDLSRPIPSVDSTPEMQASETIQPLTSPWDRSVARPRPSNVPQQPWKLIWINMITGFRSDLFRFSLRFCLT